MPKLLSDRLNTAKNRLVFIKNSKYRARALELLDDPSDLSQTDFGVCGLAAVIYTLLVHRPDKFVELAIDILNDGSLVKELRTLYWSAGPSRTPPFDYVMMAGLAYRTRSSSQVTSITVWEDENTPKVKLKRGHELFARSVKFSETFIINDKNWSLDDSGGHLATTPGSLGGIFKTVLPRASVYKFKTTMPMRTIIADVNRYFSIYKTAFAAMGIKAYEDWSKLDSIAEAKQQQKLTRWATVQTTPQPLFDHWVWLSGPIKTVGDCFQFDFWTWRDKYSVQIKSNVLKDYVYCFVAGHLDSSFV